MPAGSNLSNSGNNSEQLSLEMHSLLQESVEKSSRHPGVRCPEMRKGEPHVIS